MISIGIRTITAVLAVMLLYSSAFLREDEEGRVQNVIEGWWIRLNDLQSAALSEQMAFMRTVAAIATSWFDRLFTKKLFSLTAICVSICFTFSSLALGMLYFGQLFSYFREFNNPNRWDIPEELSVLALCGGIAAVFLFLGFVRSFLKTKHLQRIWLLSICLIVPLTFSVTHEMFGVGEKFSETGVRVDIMYDLTKESLVFIAVCTVSVIADFSLITLNRLSLRWIKQSKVFAPSIGIVIGNCVLAVLYIWIPAQLGGGNPIFEYNIWKLAAEWISAANILTALVALVFVLVALIMILHRIAWPLVERLVYALARFGIFRHRKALATVGLALLSTVFPPVQSLGKRLLEIFTS